MASGSGVASPESIVAEFGNADTGGWLVYHMTALIEADAVTSRPRMYAQNKIVRAPPSAPYVSDFELNDRESHRTVIRCRSVVPTPNNSAPIHRSFQVTSGAAGNTLSVTRSQRPVGTSMNRLVATTQSTNDSWWILFTTNSSANIPVTSAIA